MPTFLRGTTIACQGSDLPQNGGSTQSWETTPPLSKIAFGCTEGPGTGGPARAGTAGALADLLTGVPCPEANPLSTCWAVGKGLHGLAAGMPLCPVLVPRPCPSSPAQRLCMGRLQPLTHQRERNHPREIGVPRKMELLQGVPGPHQHSSWKCSWIWSGKGKGQWVGKWGLGRQGEPSKVGVDRRHTYLLAPGLVVGVKEEQASSWHWAQYVPLLGPRQGLQGLSETRLHQRLEAAHLRPGERRRAGLNSIIPIRCEKGPGEEEETSLSGQQLWTASPVERSASAPTCWVQRHWQPGSAE